MTLLTETLAAVSEREINSADITTHFSLELEVIFSEMSHNSITALSIALEIVLFFEMADFKGILFYEKLHCDIGKQKTPTDIHKSDHYNKDSKFKNPPKVKHSI